MRLYTPRQRLVRMHGKGIGDFFRDIVTNDSFKNTVSQIGRYAGDLGKRGIAHLTPIAKDLGKQAIDAGLAYVKDESGRVAGDLTTKAINQLDKSIGKTATDFAIGATKTGLQRASDAGLADKVLQAVDSKLGKPGRISKPAKNIGDVVKQSIANATDSRGKPIPNIDEVIKDPSVIKSIAADVFRPKPEPGTKEVSILSSWTRK